MKKLILLLIFGSLFADNNKWGFGFTFDGGNPIMKLVNLSDGLSTSAFSPTIYFPQNLSFGKVEPSISYYSRKYRDSNIDYSSSQFNTTYTDKTQSITILGVGFIENKSIYERYNTYMGLRISILMSSESDDDIYLLAPIYGAEYYFNDKFSLGGETRLNYAFDKSDEENSVIDISAHLFFRFYK